MNILFCAGPPEVMALGAGRRFFFGLLIEKNIFRFVLCYCISVRRCPREASTRLWFFSLDFFLVKKKERFVLFYCMCIRRGACEGRTRSTFLL